VDRLAYILLDIFAFIPKLMPGITNMVVVPKQIFAPPLTKGAILVLEN
jgi:hypothetical protein